MPGVSFDPVADSYDATRRLPEPLMAAVVDRLASVLGPGPVLEAGVGTGRFAVPLRSRGVRLVGVDVSRKMLALAAGKGAGDLFLGDASRLPFRDAAFPASIVIHVLHLLANWREVVHELARVTRGRVVTLQEAIRTRPVRGGAETIAYGDAVAFPMGRYQELARARGHAHTHPGVRTPDLIALAAPEVRIPVGTHRTTIPADELLAPIAAKTHSSQWSVPDDVHHAIMDVIRSEVGGATFERTWDVSVVGWRPEVLRHL